MGGSIKRSTVIWLLMAAANLVLITCIVASVMNALNRAQKASFTQNIENVRTLTDASAEKIELEFMHHTDELQRVANCVNFYQGVGMTESQMKTFFNDLYAVQEEDYLWQVVDSATNDSRGFAAMTLCGAGDATFGYQAPSYPELAKIFCAASEETLGKVAYTSEFTDPSPTLDKVSAITCAIRLRTENGESGESGENGESGESGYVYKTLMLLLRSRYVNELLSSNNDLSTLNYFDYSNIIVDDDGNYVISNAQFQGTNFLDYIELYNSSFSEEDARALQRQLHTEDYSDVLYYDNNRGQACAYTIVAVQNSDWHILSIVPLDSFHSEANFSNSFGAFALLFSLLFVLDITIVAFVNRRLRRVTKEAQAASEAKTDFLSRMSHDIRTPINVINGMTELAAQEDNPPETQDYLRDIRSSSTFLLGLVNDILDMNKVESGKMELFPIPYSFLEFKSYINAIILPMCAAKGIEFSVQCNCEDITVAIDKMRLNQIIFNLLSNAVKFTPENGHVGLDVVITPMPACRVALDFTVRDDGIGMSKAFQKTMFSAFSQESRREEQQILGTGLGLAIVKSLVDMMGGSIRVESEIGCGTTFYIHIETERSDEQTAPMQNSENSISALRGRRVLLCEDQPMNAKIIVRLLGQHDVRVDVAENGKLGVEMLMQAAPGSYDAVLMDVRMPVMNGLEATKVIRGTQGRDDLRKIPIIALTANAYDSDVRACLDAGMNEHLSKPIDKRLLFEALARQMQG